MAREKFERTNLGYPYGYGDDGPELSFFEEKTNLRILYVTFVTSMLLVTGPSVALASSATKAGAEVTRAAACASCGAFVMAAAHAAKCGNVPFAIALMCGAACALCVEKTAAVISHNT